MSRRILFLVLAVSLGLNIGLVITTLIHRVDRAPLGPPPGRGPNQGPPGEGGDLVEQHLRGMTDHLGLDEDQQAAVRLVMEQYSPELSMLQERARETAGQLVAAYSRPVFEPEQFRKLTEQVRAARARSLVFLL